MEPQEEVVAPDTVLEGLAAENQLFKTWVVGMVTGCKGCIEDATKWVEVIQPVTTEHRIKDQ